MNLITLTTDFGTRDWFVGAMKGIILGINPRAAVVDITHEIPPGDIRAGAFALAACYRYFPQKTVHVTVVDPGVGSERAAIAVRTDHYFFVGPDNGVLSFALAKERIKAVWLLANTALFLQPVSRTFHGRDIFAPVAAHLSRGLAIRQVGPKQRDFARLSCPSPRETNGVIEGEIVYIDRFGNAITNISAEPLSVLKSSAPAISVNGERLGPLRFCYAEVPQGQPLGIVGSSGFLEIAVNGASAARVLHLKIGDPVAVHD